MSTQGLEIIEHSAHTTHEWVNELAERLDWSSKRSALRLLRTVMHIVRDHLRVDEVAQLSAQLPLLLRGMFFEGWVPKRTPLRDRSAAGVQRAVEDQLGDNAEYRGLEDVTCVFELLNNHLTRGEIEHVRANLPADIRAYWPEP